VRYVDIGGLEGPVRLLNDAPLIDAKSAPSRCRQVLKTGDTVYSTVRPYLRKMARIGDQLDNEFASTGFAVLRPRPELLPAYLAYFAQSCLFEDQLLPMQKGVSYPAVLDREVRSCRIWYPTLQEQRRIVDFIEDHLAHLDAADASLTLASRRAGTAITSSAARHVNEAALSGRHTSIGREAKLIEYGSSAKASAELSERAIPVLRMGNLQQGDLDWTSLKYLSADHPDATRHLLHRGDLLFNRTNSAELVGKSAVFDDARAAVFASYLIRVRFADTTLPEWANLVINSPQGRAYVRSVLAQQVGQANVNSTKLKAFPLVLPDVREQQDRLAHHLALKTSASRLQQEIQGQKARSTALRRAVLAAAFSGRLTGRSADAEIIEEIAES